ncbi:hypothetical protein DESC_690062 [Desulfosarcina cetonica]|nr:hypothetical protein DESC_690062 [Desulfosarcina cetonica]
MLTNLSGRLVEIVQMDQQRIDQVIAVCFISLGGHPFVSGVRPGDPLQIGLAQRQDLFDGCRQMGLGRQLGQVLQLVLEFVATFEEEVVEILFLGKPVFLFNTDQKLKPGRQSLDGLDGLAVDTRCLMDDTGQMIHLIGHVPAENEHHDHDDQVAGGKALEDGHGRLLVVAGFQSGAPGRLDCLAHRLSAELLSSIPHAFSLKYKQDSMGMRARWPELLIIPTDH